MKNKCIMIVGVGGQGSLLASHVLGNTALALGYDVKVSEVHGMSQRGGSVVTYVKYGEKVHSPVICEGEADVILAFEQLEAARWTEFLKIGGEMYVNTQQISPMPVITGAAEYPSDIMNKIKASGINAVSCDALAMAKEAGSAKAVNIVLIGLYAKNSGVDKQVYLDAIKASVPAKILDINIKAFELGYSYAG